MSLESWRQLPFNQDQAGLQLALSESLLSDNTSPAFYWYRAAHPALILGAGQKTEVLDSAACLAAGLEIYRRTSGGTLVLVGPNFLSLDVVLPPDSRMSSSDITLAYRWFGETWQAALATLGLPSILVQTAHARRLSHELAARPDEQQLVKLVCFGSLSPYEVMAGDGRKLVGLAQVRRRAGTLLQAGVYFRWPGQEYARRLNLPEDQRELLLALLAQRAAGLDELISPVPGPTEVIAAFEACLVEMWPLTLRDDGWREAELRQAARLKLEKYQPIL